MVNEIKKIDGDAWAAAGEGCGRIMVSAHDTGTFAASEADGSAAERAAALVKSYLKAGAEKQVCIGDRRVAPVLEAAERGEVSAEMFDHPQGIAQGTLAQDIFPRFVESPAGQALAARRPELCEGPPAKR